MTDDLLTAAKAVDDDIHIQRAAFMLLAALEVGPRIKALRARTMVPWSALQNGSYYLRRDGVWVGQTMHYPWLDFWMDGQEGEAMVGLTLDAMVGAGHVRRQGEGLDVTYRLRYFMEDIEGVGETGLSHIDAMRQFKRPQKVQPLPLGVVHPRTGKRRHYRNPLTVPVRSIVLRGSPEPIYRADICNICGWLISEHRTYFDHPTPYRPVVESPFPKGRERKGIIQRQTR